MSVVLFLPADVGARVAAVLDAPVLASNIDALRAELEKGDVDVVIAADERSMPGFGVCRVRDALSAVGKALPAIALATGAEAVKRCFEYGAFDTVDPEELSRLPLVVQRETARRRREEDGAARAKLFEQIVDALPSILFVKDAKERRLVAANQMFATAFGVTKEWLVGKRDEEYFPKAQAEAFQATDDEVLRTKKLKILEEVVRVGAEDYIYRTAKFPLLDADGEGVYVVAVTDDVSSVRRAEEDLRRAQELTQRTLASYERRALEMEVIRQQNEDLDRLASELARAKRVEEDKAHELEVAARLKTELLANFSHEIRTPLSGILGYCELLLREEASRLSPSGVRDLTSVRQNARTLIALINDILDLAKLEAGRTEVQRELIDVTELVSECCSTVRELLHSDVQLVTRVRARAAFTDPLKLKQILLNLLSNAAKHTTIGTITIRMTNEGETLVAAVEDTGAGIPADQIPYIFEKFRQVGGDEGRASGTGLGLAIVREVVNLLGGNVDVKSVFGRGSTFVVKIPRAIDPMIDEPTPAPRRPEVVEPEAPLTPRGRILYIEDSAQNRDIMRRFLAPWYSMTEAEDGEMGVERALAEKPDLILMDLSLPRVDGWEATRRLMAHPELADIPIIAVSAHVGNEQKARAKEAGCVEYLSKPLDRESLYAAIRRYIP